MDKRWDQFDGLRVLALLVIIASHTGAFYMYGQGSVIVNLFFVLSGFFCALPMVLDGEERFFCVKGILKFYFLRIARIVPIYWLVVVFFYWISDTAIANKRFLVENLLFVNTYGHLWYLQHEMVCYLVAPLIILAIGVAKNKLKVNDFAIGAVLVLLGIVLCDFLFKSSFFCLLWNGEKRQLRVGVFVIGIGIGYLVKAIKQYLVEKKILKIIIDVIIALCFLWLMVFTSRSFMSLFGELPEGYYYGWYHPLRTTMVSAILVFLLAINRDGIIAKTLSLKPLVVMGQITYSAYLIHFFLIEFLAMSPIKQFAMVTLISYCIAYISFNFFENKIYKYAKKKASVW